MLDIPHIWQSLISELDAHCEHIVTHCGTKRSLLLITALLICPDVPRVEVRVVGLDECVVSSAAKLL